MGEARELKFFARVFAFGEWRDSLAGEGARAALPA